MLLAASLAFQQGICLNPVYKLGHRYGTDPSRRSAALLKQIGVTWVCVTPFAEMDRSDAPVLHRDRGAEGGVGEASLRRMVRDLHALGMKVMIKPFIHVDPRDGQWRGTIQMKTEEDWRTWFDAYRAFLLDAARLARDEQAELLCIGLEYLASTTTDRQAAWRRLIREVRRVYPGPLTYAANWWGEFDKVPFWDDLDFIGINFFFPVAQTPSPSLQELMAGLEPVERQVAAVSARFGKPVIFTEVGYKSAKGAAIEPWLWTSQSETDLDLQARAYEAVFRTFRHRPYMAGLYWYEWLTDPDLGGAAGPLFTPRLKPAEEVLRRWYSGGGVVK